MKKCSVNRAESLSQSIADEINVKTLIYFSGQKNSKYLLLNIIRTVTYYIIISLSMYNIITMHMSTVN